jgi:hypothetical protein
MTSMLLSDGMLEKLDSQIEKKEEVKWLEY